MRKVYLGLLLCCLLILPVSGEMAAPPVPEAGERLMPAQNQSFSQGLRQIAGELLPLLRPELARGLASGAGLVALCLLLALFPAEETGGTADLAGAVAIAVLLMGNAHSMIRMAAETVTEMSEYEKARVYYDWICQNCAYDYSAGDSSLSHIPYALFHDGTAVCDGYTGAYNLLLKLEGISCRGLSNASHIWTVATLDGTDYHIDTTWGDSSGYFTDYTYFAMTPAQSWSVHTW